MPLHRSLGRLGAAARLLAACVLFAWTGFAQPQETAEAACGSCHEQVQTVQASVHAAVACSDCHPGRETYPHPAGAATPACVQCHARIVGEHARSAHGQALESGNAAAPACDTCHGNVHETTSARSAEFRKAQPETCGMCHSEIAGQYQESVHGKALRRGVVQSAACTDCHGEHSIEQPARPDSLVHTSHIREACGQCHENVRLSRKYGFPSDRLVSYDASFHGLAARAGLQTVAHCASCHGVHNILPSSDPKSTVHAGNLPATCGHCHQGAGSRFALGPVHLWPGRTEPVSVRWVRHAYLVLIPAVVGLMLLHNLGDWVRKLRRIRGGGPGLPFRHGPPKTEIRMYPLERVQHACLMISFLVLAWTGFALEYPDQWWARPATALEGTARGWLHRGAALVFMAAAALHLFTLIASPALRRHWKELWPRREDLAQGLGTFAYNLGLRSERPRLSRYSYAEKAEYWALIWGGVIMSATGLALWANNFFLERFPKEVLDVATALHFYEAVLACLSILVWHWYFVIFDPDVYPMDTAWIQGEGVRSHDEHEEHVPNVPKDRFGVKTHRW